MEDETRKLLERDVRLNEENNKILKKMYRSVQWGRFFRILYWVSIAATAFGTYYFIQPYIGVLQELTGTLPDVSTNFEGGSGLLENVRSLLWQ